MREIDDGIGIGNSNLFVRSPDNLLSDETYQSELSEATSGPKLSYRADLLASWASVVPDAEKGRGTPAWHRRVLVRLQGFMTICSSTLQIALLAIPGEDSSMFKGVLIENDDAGYRANLVNIDEAQLPEGDVSVKVAYTGLNYKDALAITGRGKIARQFPMVPGVDLVGIVQESLHPAYKPGDRVLLNGWGVGERHWGGMAQKARLKGDWLVPLPAQFSPKQAMAIGTAGYTAMLCVLALEKHGVAPDSGEIVVTGAAGGVGSVATAVLSKLGYSVVAVTGRPKEAEYVRALGAGEVLDRSEFDGPSRPLAKARWAGAIDVVGSHTLANICATTNYRGVVTACGMAGGMEFPASVAPFILRGITLVGIDSVMCPRSERLIAWERLGSDLDPTKLGLITSSIGLNEVIPTAERMLAGEIRGRVIVDVNEV